MLTLENKTTGELTKTTLRFCYGPQRRVLYRIGWKDENEGVAPDIETEQWPKAFEAGGDPQLERAIEEVMKRLANTDAKRLDRPDYPIRVK